MRSDPVVRYILQGDAWFGKMQCLIAEHVVPPDVVGVLCLSL